MQTSMKSAAAVQTYHPLETKLALSVRRAKLEVRRSNLVDAARLSGRQQ